MSSPSLPAPRLLRRSSTSTATARRRRRCSPGASPSPARRASSGSSPTGARGAPRRRGVADRVGEVLLRARPRPRVRARPATGASSTRGSGWSHRGSSRSRRDHDPTRGHRAPHPELALRLAAAFGGCARRRSSRASRPGAPRALDTSPARNHRTLELYALFVVGARAAGARSRRPAASRGRASCTQPAEPTSGPTACTARPRRTTTCSRCALPRRCARTPPLRRDGARRVRRPARARLRRSPCTAAGPTARSPRSRTATPATTRAARARRAAARRRFDTGRPAPAAAPASPTAATSSSAAAGDGRPTRFLIFDCGPLGDGGHGHYDLLSIEAAAGGAAARRRPGPLHLRRGAAEPAPLVQGHRRPQHRLRRRARPDAVPRAASRTGRSPRARFLGRDDAPTGSTCSRGEAREPGLRGGARGAGSLFVDGAYWLDRGPADAATAAPLRPALPPRAGRGCSDRTSTAQRGARARRSRSSSLGADALRLEPGWVSPSYGRRPRRRWSARSRAAATGRRS